MFYVNATAVHMILKFTVESRKCQCWKVRLTGALAAISSSDLHDLCHLTWMTNSILTITSILQSYKSSWPRGAFTVRPNRHPNCKLLADKELKKRGRGSVISDICRMWLPGKCCCMIRLWWETWFRCLLFLSCLIAAFCIAIRRYLHSVLLLFIVVISGGDDNRDNGDVSSSSAATRKSGRSAAAVAVTEGNSSLDFFLVISAFFATRKAVRKWRAMWKSYQHVLQRQLRWASSK